MNTPSLKLRRTSKKILQFSVVAILLFSFTEKTFAGPGDTTVVQTFTYGSPQSNAWFVFPSDTNRYRKILMKYTLKCNPANTPYACGEWDYLTYTYLHEHTGTYDSNLLSHTNFEVDGNAPDSLHYQLTPSYTYHPWWQYSIHYTNTISVNYFQSGNIGLNTTVGVQTSNPVSRTQILWTAQDLGAAGMNAGAITGMEFFVAGVGASMHHFTIRIKASTLDSLSSTSWETTGLATLLDQNMHLTPGWNSFQFDSAYNWNGIDNLLIEVTYDNSSPNTDNLLAGSTTPSPMVLTSTGADRSVYFNGNDYVSVPASALAPIDSFITISYWAYGNPAMQPHDGSVFEGVNAAGQRIVNAHCPWSDGTVYWDAGNSAGWQRIQQAATQAQYEGAWHNWTFTKNAVSGVMNIYLDGNLFKTGSNFHRNMPGITNFLIGSGVGGQSYQGNMDEFTVWNTVLPQAQIQANMIADITPANPYYGNLALYYHFNDGNYFTANDATSFNHDGTEININNPLIPGKTLFRNFVTSSIRPAVIFEQGVYNSYMDSTLHIDTIQNDPMMMVQYFDPLHPNVPTDTILVWASYFNDYHYNTQGQAYDSTQVPYLTIYKVLTNYYQPYEVVNRYELARYITPYGINLTQLNSPWTWTYDVSDYATLLHDSVQLSAGNWQELLDVKFLMIQGIPPRDPIKVTNLYSGNFYYGSVATAIENGLPPKTFSVPANAASARVKFRITGHGEDASGNCMEFCQKNNYLYVNNVQRWSQSVWRNDCSKNPLQPQGGTWVYQRANWCPGAEVTTYDFELTPYIIPGDTVNLNHNCQPYSSSGGANYVIEDQVITYGAANFALDAAIDLVKSPTADQMWLHTNMVCMNPVIVLQNTGATPLTSVDIHYGMTGSTPSVFHWTGNLNFMEKQDVTLGSFDYFNNSHVFVVYLTSPNSNTDQNHWNDTTHTVINPVLALPNTFVIQLKTNLIPSEDSYTVKDMSGNTVYSVQPTLPNVYYRDTLTLPNGCYEFILNDVGEDGLSWWANSGQGSGSLAFRKSNINGVWKTFNSDFGSQIFQQFTVGYYTNVDDLNNISKDELNVYPNPTDGRCSVNFQLAQYSDVTIQVIDLNGKLIQQNNFPNTNGDVVEYDLSELAAGIYFVTMKTKDTVVTKKLVIGK